MSRRRQAGMAPNPLTFGEVEAYERKMLVHLTAWDTGLLMRLDDAVLAAATAKSDGDRASEPTQETPGDIPVSDVKGLKAMFSRVAARRRKK